MKVTDLKHLILKTAFMLALAAGKRRSKIHTWVANKVSNLGQWEKVALFPSLDFIAKNQLAREGSQSVFPVTIPALTTIVDRQFKEDRTLCLVRALWYYLDRTEDLRGLIPGSRYLVTSSGCYGKIFYLSLLYLTYNVLCCIQVCHNLIFRVPS